MNQVIILLSAITRSSGVWNPKSSPYSAPRTLRRFPVSQKTKQTWNKYVADKSMYVAFSREIQFVEFLWAWAIRVVWEICVTIFLLPNLSKKIMAFFVSRFQRFYPNSFQKSKILKIIWPREFPWCDYLCCFSIKATK